MIEVHALAKSFRSGSQRAAVEVRALDDISFTAPDGRITALLGENGAGKTTTLRIIATLVRPDRGTARVGGADVGADPLRARAQLGVLSDARGLYTRLTGRENIAYYARLHGLDDALARTRLDELAAILDLAPLLERRTQGFSTGERMKIALARALIHDPSHLILDEPTSGLDVMSTRALRRLLRELRGRGKCILFSTHVMQEVEALCDAIVVVARGRVVADGTAAALIAQAGAASLEDAFVALVHGRQEAA